DRQDRGSVRRRGLPQALHEQRHAPGLPARLHAAAEARLDRLAAAPPAAAAPDQGSAGTLRTLLTARIDRLREVETALTAERSAHLDRLRDHDLQALRVRAGLAALCLLLALGAGVHSTRSVTRPLAGLRLGARRVSTDPAAREPVSLKGRDDEFAEIARSVNVLHGTVVRQRERIALLDGERTRLDGARRDLAQERDALRARHHELAERLAGLTGRVHATYVSLSLRTLGLIERQLTVIESMEANEADPDRLETLFKLDHLATRMRRNNENLLVLAGAEHGGGHAGAVPLLDVLRAAVSEIERYERVRIHSLPARAQLAGFAADDVSHLVAELLENATAFSPPDVQVQVSGWLLESGEVMLSVQDEGIGMAPERLDELNCLLAQADPDPRRPMTGERPPADGAPDDRPVMGLGLYVVARLAARHGVRVQLRDQRPGGITAVVVLPAHLLPADAAAVPDPAAAPPVPGSAGAPRVTMPGADAEANSHVLPGRSSRAPEPARRPHPADGPAPQTPRAPHDSAEPQTSAVSEQTMRLTVPEELRTPPPARHARPAVPRQERPPAEHPPGGRPGPALPKRTPKAVPQRPAPLTVRQGVDADALRRKLAGFQQGARDGRRDAEAEAARAAEESERAAARERIRGTARERDRDRRRAGAPDEGGTVEEARG
ncbi:ATP-binding protein, partial [Streptomyces sp. NPDC049577]|uniref:sensor histidine kinase n=1 Tax=Streptomyces sp. NPDC049577 TaxID=3155153 RepID=UPI00341AE92D